MKTVAPAPLAIRAVIVLAGLALVLLPGELHPAPALVTAAGALAAAAAPRSVGSLLATGGFVAGWLAAGGWDAAPSVAHSVAAAAALYVLHLATALAAAVPLDVRLEPSIVRNWLLPHTALVLAIAAAVIAVDTAVPSRSGSPWVEFAGLAGLLALGAATIYAVRRRAAPTAKMAGRASER
jgi:hypothetical protein